MRIRVSRSAILCRVQRRGGHHDRVPPQILTVAPGESSRAGWVVDAARRRGLVLGGLEVVGDRHYWGGPLWAAAHAHELRVGLLEPHDDWLSGLPGRWLGRSVRLMTLDAARHAGRRFVKPPSSKDFPARVYSDEADLASATAGLALDMPVLVSEVVEFAAEYRLFVLDGRVHTGSRYATWGHLDLGTLLTAEGSRVVAHAEELLGEMGDTLPSAVVLDVGLVGPPGEPRRDAVVVEANMAWFAQPYWADTDRVLDVVMRAAGPLDRVSDSDRPFVRRHPHVLDAGGVIAPAAADSLQRADVREGTRE